MSRKTIGWLDDRFKQLIRERLYEARDGVTELEVSDAEVEATYVKLMAQAPNEVLKFFYPADRVPQQVALNEGFTALLSATAPSFGEGT